MRNPIRFIDSLRSSSSLASSASIPSFLIAPLALIALPSLADILIALFLAATIPLLALSRFRSPLLLNHFALFGAFLLGFAASLLFITIFRSVDRKISQRRAAPALAARLDAICREHPLMAAYRSGVEASGRDLTLVEISSMIEWAQRQEAKGSADRQRRP